jgi:hypothetical protein
MCCAGGLRRAAGRQAADSAGTPVRRAGLGRRRSAGRLRIEFTSVSLDLRPHRGHRAPDACLVVGRCHMVRLANAALDGPPPNPSGQPRAWGRTNARSPDPAASTGRPRTTRPGGLRLVPDVAGCRYSQRRGRAAGGRGLDQQAMVHGVPAMSSHPPSRRLGQRRRRGGRGQQPGPHRMGTR